MKKKFPINLENDEINLIEVFKILWDEKSRIILITLISLIIGLVYNYQKPPSFEISLKIQQSDNSQFSQISQIYNFLNREYEDKQKIYLNKIVFDKFVSYILNREYFIKILQNSKKFKSNFSLSPEKDDKTQLYSYANLFSLDKVRGTDNEYLLKFNWHEKDINIGKEVLIDVLNETLLYFEKMYFLELSNFVKIKKDNMIVMDLEKIVILKEQYQIAKNLPSSSSGLPFSKLENILPFLNQGHFRNNQGHFRNISSFTYLLGEEAILEMINSLKNRKYEIFSIYQNLINDLTYSNNFKWIEYDFFLIDVKSKNNSRYIYILSLVSGFIIGLLQVIFFRVLLNTRNK